MNTKEKLLQYIEYKDITQGKFCRKIGVSSGFLTSGKHIGSEKLKIIRDSFSDLNMNWLIYDEGKMIKNEPQFNEYALIYNRFSIEQKRAVKKELRDALKSNNLADIVEILVKDYLVIKTLLFETNKEGELEQK